jgi:hypothetical protein
MIWEVEDRRLTLPKLNWRKLTMMTGDKHWPACIKEALTFADHKVQTHEYQVCWSYYPLKEL